jgi:N-acetylglutamate synthase-like GNAT family acetyltransferase
LIGVSPSIDPLVRALRVLVDSLGRVPSRMPEIVRAISAEHFAQFQMLVDELMSWDSSMSAQIGLDVDVIVDFLYKQPGDIAHEPVDVFLATHEGGLAGCGALKHLSNEVAELSRLYVRPAYRGSGIGKSILEVILARARARGYKNVCLETAIFMTDAHALYRSLGFQATEPFRQVPEGLKSAELFMELRLADAS